VNQNIIKSFKTVFKSFFLSFLFLLYFTNPTFASVHQDNIIITEVEYDTTAEENEAEWFELFNPTDAAIDLANWTIKEGAAPIYTFPNPTVLQPGEFLLVVNDAVTFNIEHPGITPDLEMDPGGSGLLRLNNTGDELTLKDAGGTAVDYVAWEGYAVGWDANAAEGESACRTVSQDTDAGTDFTNCASSSPGSGVYHTLLDDFILTIDTSQGNTNNSFTIRTWLGNFDLDCDNNGIYELTNLNADTTCNYAAPYHGKIRVKHNNLVTHSGFNNFSSFNAGDKEKVTGINQWGSSHWTLLNNTFSDCSNLANDGGSAQDVPDLSGVSSLRMTFMDASNFNQPLNNWDVSNITDLSWFLSGATSFNQPLNNWNVSQVSNMNFLFKGATNFNQPLDNWNTLQLTSLYNTFEDATSFNQPLNTWNTSQVTHMDYLFDNATNFNQSINNWNTSQVVGMERMFVDATNFNQDISFKVGQGTGGGDAWNTSQVTNMSQMFSGATNFNQNIGGWNTSQVTDFYAMFYKASNFNQDIGYWDISSATTVLLMFGYASSFNQDLSTKPGQAIGGGDAWDISNLTSLESIFFAASSFNQDLSNWDTSHITTFRLMLYNTTNFNQDLSSWDVSQITNIYNMLYRAENFSRENYDALLISWNAQAVHDNLDLSTEAHYCDGAAAREKIRAI